jgi:ribosomal 50S subunit-recycling heat shock protein
VRLDKFLQVSRLVRRRALANSLCHAGRVTLNGRAATPAAAVRPGDILTIAIADRRIRARVLATPEHERRPSEIDWVEILEDAPAE